MHFVIPIVLSLPDGSSGSRSAPLRHEPARRDEGIAQVLFFESDEDCEVSYRDKKGKYQGQERITLPTILGRGSGSGT